MTQHRFRMQPHRNILHDTQHILKAEKNNVFTMTARLRMGTGGSLNLVSFSFSILLFISLSQPSLLFSFKFVQKSGQIKRINTFSSGFQSIRCRNSRETGIWLNTMMNYNHQLYDDTKTTDRSLGRNKNKSDDNNGESSLESTYHDSH